MKAAIEVWKIDEPMHPYPWRFAVTFNGVQHEFTGLENQCETKRQAAARASWRARWLENGTYNQRYRLRMPTH